MGRLQPEYWFTEVGRVPLGILRQQGVRLLLCDIDNTLVTYDDPEPTEDAAAFLASLREAGIAVAFLSNNSPTRVEAFNRSLGYPIAADAKKPFCRREVKRLMAEAGADRDSTWVLGDQVFTDLLTARFCRLPVILVCPIKDKKTLLFRFKRWLEKPIYAAYCRRFGANSENKDIIP